MNLLEVFSFLGTIAIFIAAFLFSSKKVINPKIKILAFISYIGACFFLGIWGILLNSSDGNWMIIQQIFLFFINIKGIKNARRQLKNERNNRC